MDEMEVIRGIDSLKEEKSPGPDKITNEALKIGRTHLATPLARLFNMVLKSSCTPRQWSESEIILLYKKGNPHDISNYRPISLLPSIYKLFSSLLEKRIRKSIEKHQPVEQAGFRRSFSTVDHIHSLEMLIEKYQEFRRPLYMVFIDYQKAFDSILHSSIWEALHSQQVEIEYIRVLEHLYGNTTSRIKLETTGPPIHIKRGVRQGDPISPTIFIAVLESIICKLDWRKLGLNINGKYLNHLRFADDIVLFSEDIKQLQSMVNSLYEESRKAGLEINLTMEKPARYKAKSKKPAAKPKTAKKRKSDGPTCSMFLAELTRKLAYKRKQQAAEEPRNIIQTIIDSITSALPIKVSKKNSPQKYPSPMKMETLQSFAPELMPSDTLHYTPVTSNCIEDGVYIQEVEIPSEKPGSFKMPKMPIVNSEVIKLAVHKKKKMTMQDQGVNTGAELDVAAEISKHVSTLRKISLIAEEFNQKTAKNLKEIVDSVQEDLIKKLAEIQAEQSSERAFQIQEESRDVDD